VQVVLQTERGNSVCWRGKVRISKFPKPFYKRQKIPLGSRLLQSLIYKLCFLLVRRILRFLLASSDINRLVTGKHVVLRRERPET
jgi:hypothetical protein